jgi:hypothetical protein
MADIIGEITMRSGDQTPLLAVAVEDDMGVPVNLSTATSIDIIFTNTDGADPRRTPSNPPLTTLVLPGQIVDGPNGVVVYDWTVADAFRPGIVAFAVIAHLPSGDVIAPTDHLARIVVRPDVVVG